MAGMSGSRRAARKKAEDKAFYEKQTNKESSADIIADARAALRTVRTTRPFTPREDKRTLFSGSTTRAPTERPPSAFSLGSRHFDGPDSRPPSGSRLSPLDHKPSPPPSLKKISIDDHCPKLPKPPTIDPKRGGSGQRRARPKLLSALSQDGSAIQVLPKPMERKNSAPKTTSAGKERRVQSGPKERTKHLLDDGDVDAGTGDEGLTRPSPDSGVPRVRSADSIQTSSTSSSRASTGSTGSTSTERSESGYSSDRHSASSRSGSGGKREDETPEEALYWNERVSPILEKLASLSKVKLDQEGVLGACGLCNDLYSTLEARDMLGRGAKRRSSALKTVFKLLDQSDPGLLLKASKIVLALDVTGSNLKALCRLLFKLSRDEKNDSLFLDKNLLDLIVTLIAKTDYISNCEALVYCVGGLKCLSANTELNKVLSEKGLIEAFGRILKSVNASTSSESRSKNVSNLLLQIVGTLRHLADRSENRHDFLANKVINHLCGIMELFTSDGDLMMHVSRILSKLTLNNDCTAVLAEHPTAFQSLLALINKHPDRNDLVVRVGFVLGNLTARNDDCRYCLFNTEGAMEVLQGSIRRYLAKDLRESMKESGDAKQDNTTEDVLIKLIRVVANLSINPDIGPLIAANETCVDLLMQVLESKDISQNEELVLNALITINNLSFYDIINSAIVERQIQIARLLLKQLVTDHHEGMIEASRVFGNLSRSIDIRNFLTAKKVDEMMVTLLDSGNREFVYTSCGVLINLMADVDRRPMLKREGGVSKLIDVLRDFGRSDWQLAGMVCMTLWNYSENILNSNETFGEQETGEFTELLVDYLDEEVALEVPEDADWDAETQQLMKSYWKTEFCPVASQLLDRIEHHHSDLIPIDSPSNVAMSSS
ncbi:armadillo repeat-containing protein 2 [Strongylocentrotus purpuratus]|uniref:Armadillo repeat-containing protein 2 n=1 Tax=Strongylocentrotus purpuratus TaxID=7668 RepID=A0A7M7PFS9_STRPU|nr:armadillo repeat-containing protein 2 [Strongylocentrotus purpuratus]|eukprot:XP_785628.3 PREDICTED: armadillo repeat-containing protein 2 [Strongylocentrotus purpuratus]